MFILLYIFAQNYLYMDKLTQNLEPLKSKLKNHNLYNIINTPEDLKIL